MSWDTPENDSISRDEICWNHYSAEHCGADSFTLTDKDIEKLRCGEILILPIKMGEYILILKGPGHAELGNSSL